MSEAPTLDDVAAFIVLECLLYEATTPTASEYLATVEELRCNPPHDQEQSTQPRNEGETGTGEVR